MFASFPDDDGNESDDSAKRIKLPNLKYGYRSEPFQWEELMALFDSPDDSCDLERLCRSVEKQRDYEVFKRDLLLTWRSVLDSVLCDKFDEVFERKMHNGKYIASPSLSEVKGVHKRLVLNDFPYFMSPEIDHYVLWKIGGGACNEPDINEGKQQLVLMGYDNAIIHWVNPPNLKSIPEVDHVHMLARRMKEDTESTIV